MNAVDCPDGLARCETAVVSVNNGASMAPAGASPQQTDSSAARAHDG
jgi:hypothetical protein